MIPFLSEGWGGVHSMPIVEAERTVATELMGEPLGTADIN